MSFIFCGSSIPEKFNNLRQYKFNSVVSPAVTERERYLLEAIQSTKHNDIYFVTTGLRRKNQSSTTEKIWLGNVMYILLGYTGSNKYIRTISLIISSFVWFYSNIRRNDVICVYNFPIVYAAPLYTLKLFIKYKLIIDFEDRFNKNDIRYYINLPIEIIGLKIGSSFIAASPCMYLFISRISNKTVYLNSGYLSVDVSIKKIKKDLKYISLLYSGSLDHERGILELIDIFKSNKDTKYQLIITGSGILMNDIQIQSDDDKRIHYYGNLTKDKYHNIILKSDICINPQWAKISINFPSKVTMYLSYGKHVISTKHSALINSFYKNYIKFYDETAKEFWKKVYLLSKDISHTRKMEFTRKKKLSTIFKAQQNLLVKYFNSV